MESEFFFYTFDPEINSYYYGNHKTIFKEQASM